MDIFLTFLIITYRRPEKVVRLLQSFLDDRWQQLDYLKFEIVIADDHSEDNTLTLIQTVVEKLQEKGWSIRYVYRDKNLRGDRNLYYGYTRDSLGQYVWFLCDDDIIYVQEAIYYIKTIEQAQPLVAICGFEQGDKNQFGNKFDGNTRLISDFRESIDYLTKFPKTSAYLIRRCPDVSLDVLFEKLDLSLFAWIGISIYLIAIKPEEKVLIYPNIVATADDDYALLLYSFRVFGKLYYATKDSIEFAGITFENIRPNLSNVKDDDEIILNLTGLQAHYSKKTPIRYTADVHKKELIYLKNNWFQVFKTRPRLIAFSKLVFHRLNH